MMAPAQSKSPTGVHVVGQPTVNMYSLLDGGVHADAVLSLHLAFGGCLHEPPVGVDHAYPVARRCFF
ncbi:MAG: hypothetical protein ACKO9F_12795, partial [Caldilinea sp.]